MSTAIRSASAARCGPDARGDARRHLPHASTRLRGDDDRGAAGPRPRARAPRHSLRLRRRRAGRTRRPRRPRRRRARPRRPRGAAAAPAGPPGGERRDGPGGRGPRPARAGPGARRRRPGRRPGELAARPSAAARAGGPARRLRRPHRPATAPDAPGGARPRRAPPPPAHLTGRPTARTRRPAPARHDVALRGLTLHRAVTLRLVTLRSRSPTRTGVRGRCRRCTTGHRQNRDKTACRSNMCLEPSVRGLPFPQWAGARRHGPRARGGPARRSETWHGTRTAPGPRRDRPPGRPAAGRGDGRGGSGGGGAGERVPRIPRPTPAA